MRNLRPFLALMISSGLALAQGTFVFQTYLPPGFAGPNPLNAPVFDRDGVTLLNGTRYSVQFYAGAAGATDVQLAAVEPVLGFATGEGHPDGEGASVNVPGVLAGAIARLQLRAWDNESGQAATWETATVRGASASFSSPALGTGTRFNNPPPLGLKSFLGPRSDPAVAPVAGVFARAFQNLHYSDPLGGFTPSETDFKALSGDGHTVLVQYWPGTGPVLISEDRLFAHERLSETMGPLLNPVAGAGDTEWRVSGLSRGGGVLSARRMDPDGPHGYVIRNGVPTLLPLSDAAAVSGDGRFVFGLNPAGDLVRLALADGAMRVLVDHTHQPAPQANLKVSHDGGAALVRLSDFPSPTTVTWSAVGGLVETILPRGFQPNSLSGEGRLLVGQAEGRPAYWTAAGGVVVLYDGEPGVAGRLTDVSQDGSVMCGLATTPLGRLQFWTRDGRGHRLAELLPAGRNAPLQSVQGVEAVAISEDGRTAFGVYTTPPNPGTPADGGWIADLVFPGDGVTVRAQRLGLQRVLVSYPTVLGFRYRVQRASKLGEWTPTGDPTDGDGQLHQLEVTGPEEKAFFRVVSQAMP